MANPSDAAVTSLLNFGILAMEHGHHRSLPMNQVVLLLSSMTEAARLIPAFIGTTGKIGPSAAGALHQRLLSLEDFLRTVSHDNCFRIATVQSVVPPCIAAAFLVMRFCVRHFLAGGIRRDDWAMFGTWLLALAMMIAMYLNATMNHANYHIWDLSFVQYSGFLKEPANSCNSFMIFYWDLAPIRSMRMALVIVFVITTMSITAGAFCIILQCKPVAFWNDPVGAKYLPLAKIWLATGVLTIAGDIALFFIPTPYVWRLKITTREKIIVIAMFGIGAFVCIASAYRVVTTVHFVNNPDITYKVGISQMWAVLEINLGIIVSCIPAMRALVVRFTPKLIGYSNGSGQRKSSQPVVPPLSPGIRLENLEGDKKGEESADRIREGRKREWMQRRDQRDKKYRIGVGLTSDGSTKDGESILEAVRTVMESNEELPNIRTEASP